MTDTFSISDQAHQYAIDCFATSELLPYHNVETLHRVLDSLELMNAEEKLAADEIEMASVALCFYFTGFGNVAAADIDSYFKSAGKKSLANLKEWSKGKTYTPKKANAILQLLKNLIAGQADSLAADALYSDWASENGETYFAAFLEELVTKTGLHREYVENEGLRLLYNHHYFTEYGKNKLEPGKIRVIEKLEKHLKQVEHKMDILLKKELQVDEEELKQMKKKLKALKERDDKSFMDMLRSTSRNHYTLNQMVDRKARIIVWVNAFVLSLIVNRILEQPDLNDWRFYLLMLPSISGILSIAFAVLSVRLEKNHGKLSVVDILRYKGNPLFFGNFQTLSLDEYENSMLAMVNNKEFVYRAMIQDIYFLGQILQQKSRYLYTSLYIFLAGISMTLILTFLLRLLFAH